MKSSVLVGGKAGVREKQYSDASSIVGVRRHLHGWCQKCISKRHSFNVDQHTEGLGFRYCWGHLLRIEQKDQCHKLAFNGVVLLTRNGFQSYSLIKCRFFCVMCHQQTPPCCQPASSVVISYAMTTKQKHCRVPV